MDRYMLEQKQFRMDFEVQKQIIRRYDEVMNTKASKVSLKTIQNEMESLVEIKLEDTKQKLENMKSTAMAKLE